MWQKALRILKWTGISLVGLALTITLLLLIFKKDIQDYALRQLDRYLDTPVYVRQMDVTFWKTFPYLSIEFDDVLIRDQYAVDGTRPDTLLYSEKLVLKLNTSDFWKGDYTVKSIDLNRSRLGLRVFEDGRVNYQIFKTDTTAQASEFKFVLDKVRATDLDFSYDNRITSQHYSAKAHELNFFGSFTDERFDLKTSGDLLLKRIRSKSVSLITNKRAQFDVVIAIDKTRDAFELAESIVTIENLPFVTSCSIVEDVLDFRLSAKQLALTDFANNFNHDELDEIKKFKGSGTVDFNLAVQGPLSVEQPPLIRASFSVRNGKLTDPGSKLELKQIALEGSYSNNFGNGEVLDLKQLRFASLNSTFSAQLTLSHFDKPEIKGSASGTIDLNTLHRFFPIPGLKSISGQLGSSGSFHVKLNDPKRDPSNITIFNARGDFDLKQIALDPGNEYPSLNQINGKISLSRDNAVFSNLTLRTGKSSMELSGSIRNILGYFSEKSKLQVDAIVEVNELHSADFYSNKANAPAPISLPGAFILPKNISGKALVSIRTFYLDAHQFDKLTARFVVEDRNYTASNIQFTHTGALINGAMQISEQQPGKIDVTGKFTGQQIEFKKLFKEWNNFDQTMVTHEQISGKASVDLSFYLPFTIQKGLQKELLEADARFTIQNGALKNVETFKSITGSLRESSVVKAILGQNIDALEKRLLNLQFATLENTLEIKRGKITLPKMKIRSNALDIDISGWHAFNNDLDYHLEFKLRDLKFNKKDSEFGEIEDDGTGKRIFLHLFGNVDNLNFKWDGDANKAYKQEQRQQEKENVKSMLKSELGLFKKDSTVSTYQQTEKPRERIEILFSEDEKDTKQSDIPQEKKKMKKLFGMDLEKMREENKKEAQMEFSIGD
jgi:hypothetical protein